MDSSGDAVTMKAKFINIGNKAKILAKKATHLFKNWFSKLAKVIEHHKEKVIIGLASIPLLVVLSLFVHWYLTTPFAPQIKEANASSDYLYEADSRIFGVKIGEKNTNIPKVQFSLAKTDESVTFYPVDSKTNLQKPTEADKEIKFTNVYDNVDFSYQTIPLGVKEDIIIKKPGSSTIYPFYLEAKNVTPKYYSDKFAGGVFYDESKNYLFHFEKPFAVDAKGARTNNVGISVKKDTQTKKLVAILAVDSTWLKDPKRAYPVTVDPTVVHDTSAEFATGQNNRITDTGSGSSPVLETYYQEAPTDQHTVGLWHMNESSGTTNVADSSGNGNTGTSTSTTNVTTGLIGNARNNSASDYTSIGNNATLNPTSGLTLEAWVYPTDYSGGWYSIFGKDNWNSSTGYNLFFDTNGYPQFWVSGTNIYCAVQPPLNTWTHLAATTNGSIATIYINGVPCTTTATAAITNTSSTLYIGARHANDGTGVTNQFSGALDEARISNIVRTPAEIQMDAQRRPYGVYTSDVIDLSQTTTSWNSLSWTELGAATGDGETIKDSTNLVAQWNLNESTGKTTAVAAGSCGSACTGALINFGPTDSQDGTVASGWTADNKRWGTGALMFDGSDDWVWTSTDSSLNITGALTIESWIKTRDPSGLRGIFGKMGGSGYGYTLRNRLGYLELGISSTGVNWYNIISKTYIADGNWHYVVGVFEPSTSMKVYVDGKLDNSTTLVPASIFSNDGAGALGATYNGSEFFSGVIDSTRIYSRALDANEILTNYNAGNVELQTRVGSSSDPNDGTWEDWKPTTNETAVESFDSNTSSDSYTTLLLHGDGANDSTKIIDSSKPYSPHILTANGNAQINTSSPKFGDGSMFFDGSGDYISTPDSPDWNLGDGDFTIDFWVRFNTLPALGGATNVSQNIVSQTDSTPNGWGVMLWVWSGDNTHYRLNFHSKDGTTYGVDKYWDTVTAGTWYHVAIVRSNSNISMFINGSQTGTSSAYAHTIPDIANDLWVGGKQYNIYVTTSPLDGWLDEFRMTKGLARWTSGFTPPTSAYENTVLTTSTDTVTKMEGAGSEKIVNNRAVLDGSTAALWHLDETGGSGAYLKDASASATNLTPTGSTVINAVSGKGRSFNGSSDYLSVAATPNSSVTNWTLEAWINPDNLNQLGFATYNGNDSGGYGFGVGNGSGSAGSKLQGLFGGVAWVDSGYTFPSANQWYHIAMTRDSTTTRFYVNGIPTANTSAATPGTVTSNYSVGMQYNSGDSPTRYFAGKVDEVRVSKVTRSASEITEDYRMGRDHYLNKTISATDISGKNSLPFYVAADRPGTYLQATAGESAYANYQTDTNTIGLWHLDEATGSAQTSCATCFLAAMDSSGNGNDGYWNGSGTGLTSFTQGDIGKARNFNGTSDYIHIPGSTSLNTQKQITVEAWIKPSGASVRPIIEYNNGSTFGVHMWQYDAFGKLFVNFIDSSGGQHAVTSPNGMFVAGNWYHVAATYDGNVGSLYVNGKLVASTILGTFNLQTSYDLYIGTRPSGTPYYYTGIIDEARISNTARSADEIRQAYEVGARSHNVTIDFGAALDSGNLITGCASTSSCSDASFTVDATTYGASNMGSNLYLGDKIIVRENYGGTEYIAQGTVNGVTAATGAVTVASWDAGSTFPDQGGGTYGFTANADVFKWQREYWDISEPLDSQLNATTNITLRLTNGDEGRTIWIDDLKSAGDYLTDSSGSTITSSTGYRYFQYRVIEHTSDPAVSPSVTAITLDYADGTPTAPTDLYTESAPNPVGVTSTTPQFSAICNDPNTGDILNKYRIQVSTDAAFGSTVWDSGASGTSMTNCTQGTRSSNITYAGSALSLDGTIYYWRIKFWDDDGVEGAWSTANALFQMSLEQNNALNFGTPGSCRIQGSTDDSSLTLLWDDNSTGETQFRIEKNTDSGGFTFLTNAAANATSNVDSVVSQGHTYQYRVRAEGSVNTEWCTTATVSLQAGTFEFKGLNMKGINIQ